jgi:predicted dehydrogenase
MAMLKAGVIGCGGRGQSQARGYHTSPDVDLVACADPVEAARKAFAEKFSVSRTYSDYRQMLEKERPDIVSVTTWTTLHKEITIAAAHSGVKAIHSEKPMAPSWGDAKQMNQACLDNDVVLTFSHQRRFSAPYVKAKQLANDGTIGQLVRVEGTCPNLFDWGTHWFDMFFFYNNDEPAEWVIGQIDASEPQEVFGVPVESSGVSWVGWKNGVEGLLATGGTAEKDISNRLIGTDGIIEIGRQKAEPIRVLSTKSQGWTVPDLSDPKLQGNETVLSVLDLIDAVKNDREPELIGWKALQATELIFATYESSRRRAKINLPLDVDDSAFVTMLESGMIGSGPGN